MLLRLSKATISAHWSCRPLFTGNAVNFADPLLKLLHRPASHRSYSPEARWGPPPPGTPVHICMSGGVDSSVAACLLRDQGYDLRPIYMRNWETLDEASGSGGCEWEKEWADVERLCRENLGGIKPELVDLSREYWSEVFEPSLSSWTAGMTPNPDVMCNREVKFKALPDRLLSRDPSAWIATGHYAQLFPSPYNPAEPGLYRASFTPKDQSYYLATSSRSTLKRTLFPLGHLPKEEVRRLAREFGVHTSEKKESMGICFVGVRKQFGNFLDSYLPPAPGNIEDETGRVVGTHHGLWRYTIGERARLSGFPQKMFVGGKSLERNAVIVVAGGSPMLECVNVSTDDFLWTAAGNPSPLLDADQGLRVMAQTRSLQAGALTACTVHRLADNSLAVSFETPLVGVSPGQVVVLYDGNLCLGGGTITSTRTRRDELGEST